LSQYRHFSPCIIGHACVACLINLCIVAAMVVVVFVAAVKDLNLICSKKQILC